MTETKSGIEALRWQEGRDGMPPEDNTDSVEALSWLEQADGKDRTISTDSQTYLHADEGLRLVRELYAAGATEVLAQGITVEYEFEDASSLKAMLPKDLSERAALFAIEARALKDMGSLLDSEGERGQDAFGLGW